MRCQKAPSPAYCPFMHFLEKNRSRHIHALTYKNTLDHNNVFLVLYLFLFHLLNFLLLFFPWMFENGQLFWLVYRLYLILYINKEQVFVVWKTLRVYRTNLISCVKQWFFLSTVCLSLFCVFPFKIALGSILVLLLL